MTGYTVSLGEGPLCGPRAASVVLAVGGEAGAALASPTVNADGGLDPSTPIAELPPRSGYLITLEAAP